MFLKMVGWILTNKPPPEHDGKIKTAALNIDARHLMLGRRCRKRRVRAPDQVRVLFRPQLSHSHGSQRVKRSLVVGGNTEAGVTRPQRSGVNGKKKLSHAARVCVCV